MKFFLGTMRFNLSLSQMGLILLGIPAVFELVFVIALFALLHQAESEIKQESHSRDVIAHAHNLAGRITNAAIAIGAYGYSKSAIAKQSFESSVSSMKTELKELTRLLQKDKTQLTRLLELTNTVELTLTQIEQARIAIEKSSALTLLGGDSTMSDNLEKLSALAGRMQKQIDELVRAEQRSNRNLPLRRARSRQSLLALLVAGLVLNITIAIMLAGFFSRMVTRRHLVLVDNTNRLANAQALHPPLEGNDEIAQLDRVFHRMVKSLDAANDFKKQLIAMVSHELRAPLTSVDAILTFLEAGGAGELSEGVKRRLLTAEAEVQRLISLINDLLDVEKMEAGKFEMSFRPCKIEAVIERSLAAVSGAIEKKGILIESAQNQAEVLGDEDRLIQVLVNLLSNAIKFSPENGRVLISVVEHDEEIELRVKDEGKGISEEFKSKIFERFSQAELSDSKLRGGSGLGLTVSRAIVLQHGGKIGVESKEGEGACFWFSIPRKADELVCEAAKTNETAS